MENDNRTNKNGKNMKIRGTFVMREIAGETILVPVGETALKHNGMLTVSASGKEIWKMLEEGAGKEEIVEKLLEKYEVDRPTAEKDTEEFLQGLEKAGFIEAE